MTRAERIELGHKLFEVAGSRSDLELASTLGMPAGQVRECRAAAAPGQADPCKAHADGGEIRRARG